jgi:hypothetical protein
MSSNRGRRWAVLLAACFAPVVALAERAALTVEGGGAVVGMRLSPSVGSGDAVFGSLGGPELRVRYALTNRLELQAGGFWNAPASFVNTQVRASTGAGPVVGALRRDVGRLGVLAGARFVLAGHMVRFPVGLEAGWVRTSYTKQDLVDRTDPQRPVSYGLRIEAVNSNRLLLAPSAGVEWLVTDHLSISIVPRLEIQVGAASSTAIAVPLAIGWSWYLL